MRFPDMVEGENGLLVELRCNNSFNDQHIRNINRRGIMAKRPAFFIKQGKVVSEIYSFEWFPGFAISQKQKSIESLHNTIMKADTGTKPLEISTKSKEAIGIKLSAFNLKLNNYALENIFQSAKVFENGGPYLDLLDFIYIAAVKKMFAADEINAISNYNYYTDIEFNPAKSINTQAREIYNNYIAYCHCALRIIML